MARVTAAKSHKGRDTDIFATLGRILFGGYRPERHYMRGPGPKWQAKHSSSKQQQTQDGGDSRVVGASTGQTRATPDPRQMR